MKKIKNKKTKIQLMTLVITQIVFISNLGFADICADKSILPEATLSPQVVADKLAGTIMLKALAMQAEIDTAEIKNIKIRLNMVKNKKGMLKEEELQAIFSNRKNVIGRLAQKIEIGRKSYDDIALLLYVITENMETHNNLPLFIATELARNEPIKKRRKQGFRSGSDFEAIKIIYDFLEFAIMFDECHELLKVRPLIIKKLEAYVELNLNTNLKNLNELIIKFDEFYVAWREEKKVIEIFNNKLLDLISQWGKFTSRAEKMFYAEEGRISIGKTNYRRHYVKTRDHILREALKDIYCVFPNTNLLKLYLARLHKEKIKKGTWEDWFKDFDWKMLEVMMDIFYARDMDNGERYQWQEQFKEELFTQLEKEKLRPLIILLKIAVTSDAPDVEERLLNEYDDYELIQKILQVFRSRITNENVRPSFNRRHESILRKIILREKLSETEQIEAEKEILPQTPQGVKIAAKAEAQARENTVILEDEIPLQIDYEQRMQQALQEFKDKCLESGRKYIIDLWGVDFNKIIWDDKKCDAVIIPPKLTDAQVIEVLQHVRINAVLWILPGYVHHEEKNKDRIVRLGQSLNVQINKTQVHTLKRIISVVLSQDELKAESDIVIVDIESLKPEKEIQVQHDRDKENNKDALIDVEIKDRLKIKVELTKPKNRFMRKRMFFLHKILDKINSISIKKRRFNKVDQLEQSI